MFGAKEYRDVFRNYNCLNNFYFLFWGVFSKFVIKRLEKYVSKTSNKFDNSLVFSMEGPAILSNSFRFFVSEVIYL